VETRHVGQHGGVRKLLQAAAVNRVIALCLVVLQLIVSIGLGLCFWVAAADFGAPSAVVKALLALGLVIGVLNAWHDIRDPESSYAIRWLRRRKPQP
jgi:membrane protein YdbS with pleckstrin-like domain